MGLLAHPTAASWVIGRLPGQVVDEQRAELIRMLAKAGDLVVEVHCRSAVMLVRDGDRALLKIRQGDNRQARSIRQAVPASLTPYSGGYCETKRKHAWASKGASSDVNGITLAIPAIGHGASVLVDSQSFGRQARCVEQGAYLESGLSHILT
jgi:hypothetical protein